MTDSTVWMEMFQKLHAHAWPIWRSGGWGMVALAVNGLVLFATAARLLFGLSRWGAFGGAERAWRRWKRDGPRVRGRLANLVAMAMKYGSPAAIQHIFAHVHAEEVRPFGRDLAVMKVAVGAAPLLGLLGTVTGMLTTFRGLATGGGGQQTMEMIARGISEALITTETGLVLALTRLACQYVLTRLHERLDASLAHLEVLCLQEIRTPVRSEPIEVPLLAVATERAA